MDEGSKPKLHGVWQRLKWLAHEGSRIRQRPSGDVQRRTRRRLRVEGGVAVISIVALGVIRVGDFGNTAGVADPIVRPTHFARAAKTTTRAGDNDEPIAIREARVAFTKAAWTRARATSARRRLVSSSKPRRPIAGQLVRVQSTSSTSANGSHVSSGANGAPPTQPTVNTTASKGKKKDPPPAPTTTTTTTTTLPTTTTTLPPTTSGVGLFPDSLFDQPLGATSAPAPDSAQLVASLSSQIASSGGVGVNNTGYGIPVFDASASQPLVPISVSSGCDDFLGSTGAAVPIPPDAVPASGTDSSMIIYQPSTGDDWEFWQAHNNDNGTWSACWGGEISGISSSNGVFPNGYGVAGSGISYLATLVTFSDVESGAIDHVIPITVPSCNGMVAPADRTDCGNNPGEVSEGTLLRFPSSLPMPSGLTPFAQLVFHAIQDYGAVVQDQSGGVFIGTEASAAWAEQGNSGTDPITTSFAGKGQSGALSGVPWGDLEVVAPPG